MIPHLPWMLVNILAVTVAIVSITVVLYLEPAATMAGLTVLIGILVYTLGDRRSH